ncbi:hypothetical protein AB2B38_012285 [Balneola sp. MJW-20]|uniref:hypothetical protein n=1 Tax=Gracilimonas aurantiaca TaxID=3234185 RepID=UPI00390B8CD4
MRQPLMGNEKPEIYWTKDAFRLNYSFFLNSEPAGFIRDKSLSRSSEASLLGNNFLFESSGFIRTHIDIIDRQNKSIAGRINFSIFTPKAEIRINKNSYLWKLDNLMGSKWVLKNSDDRILMRSENRKEGYCLIENDTSILLLLSSLVIRNQYSKQGY